MMTRRFWATAAIAAMLSACGGSGDEAVTAAASSVDAVTIASSPNAAEAATPQATTQTSATLQTAAVSATAVPAAPLPSPGSKRYPAIKAIWGTKGITLPIGKCLNYSGQLDVASNPPWMRKVVDADFAQMYRVGFRTLRVPVNFARFAGKAPGYTIDPTFMKQVKHVVDTAGAARLNVIIDNHIDNLIYTDPPAGKARLLAMWKQIAATFSNQGGHVYFELWNEPKNQYYNSEIVATLKPVIAAIRQTNPKRPIIIDGRWADIWSLMTLDMPDDPYVVPTLHYYEPLAFTHQGATFTSVRYPSGVTFGSSADLATLDYHLRMVKSYIQRTGRVPFVGEYGVYEGAPIAQRAKYVDYVSHAFASIGVQSCIWGYVNDFPIRDRNDWFWPILNMIATTR